MVQQIPVRTLRVCNQPGCPNITTTPRCPEHMRAAEIKRGTAHERGYNTKGHQTFRYHVLTRDPICVLCGAAESTVADHHPRDRRTLINLGMNPNDPQYGRGLCKHCHDIETAHNQPGGWHRDT